MKTRGRKLVISNRHLRHSIATMVQNDPVRALVELITNSDDSYARLEAGGEQVSGKILVDIIERRSGEPSIIRVSDEAEGFSAEELELKLGRMGESTSGLEDGVAVRGFFGDGLKEALLGLGGGGTVYAIQDNRFVSAELRWEGGEPTFYPPVPPSRVTRALRRQYQLPTQGSTVEIEVGSNIRLPRHETLQQDLMLHVALRDIVQNPDRQLFLRRVSSAGKELKTDQITYHDPLAAPEFKPVTAEGRVPGYENAKFTLVVKRAKEELTGAEMGMKRIGGLVVQSKRALVDITLFGHENRPGTERLFGRLTCDYLYDMLSKGEMVVTKYRAGLAKENEFVKRLAAEVDKILEPIVKQEANRLQQLAHAEDPLTRRRLDEARRELNKIAHDELELTGPGDEAAPAPFQFEYTNYRVYVGDSRVSRLLISSDILDGPQTVKLSAPSKEVEIEPTRLRIDPQEAIQGRITAELTLKGKDLLEEGFLVAQLGPHRTEARLVVMEPPPPPKPFSFEHDNYRATVGQWRDVVLRIQVSRVLSGPNEVTFSIEGENIRFRPDSVQVEPSQARSDWLPVTVQVFGDQVGQTDTLVATMNRHVAKTTITISTQREHNKREDKGGLIQDIIFDDTKENPAQRTLFLDGVIRIYVNEPSIRRYLKRPEDRNAPAGRAVQAELVLQAFCRYLAVRKTEIEPVFMSGDLGSSMDSVLRQQDKLLKVYGEKLHSIINPR